MNIDYCEVCGVLIQSGQGPVALPEGVICGTCFETRRVVDTAQTQGEISDGLVQFDCCYCHSLLRLKAVSKRTRVRCPKCNDAFFLHEDGRIEARLEGSKTAVLQQDDVAPLGRTDRAGDKTQPIKRSEVVGAQHAMLEELKPKSLDFVDALPQRSGTMSVDTSAYRRADVPAGPGLSASDEGKVDLGASELRRKTQGMQAVPQPAPEAEPARSPAGRPARSRSTSPAGQAPEAPAAERRPGKALWVLVALPLLVGVGFAAAAYARVPFTHQGNIGRRLNALGETVERGVRSVDSLLPAHARMALPSDVAPVTSR